MGERRCDVQVIDANEPTLVLASMPADQVTQGVAVDAGGFDVSLTVDATAMQLGGGIEFDGGAGASTLIGPGLDSTWHVNGQGSGDLGGPSGVEFQNVANLVGAADNQDTFVIGPGGGVNGSIDGGAGGFDTLVLDGTYQRLDYAITGPQSGDLGLDGSTLRFDGMEPILVTGTAGVVSVSSSIQDDTLQVQDIPDTTLSGTTVTMAVVPGSGEQMEFANPSAELDVTASHGTVELDSLDPNFAAGLVLSGDTVNVPGNIRLPGLPVTVNATTIDVSGTIDVSVPNDQGTAGCIRLTGKDVTVDSGAASNPAQLLAKGDSGQQGLIDIEVSDQADFTGVFANVDQLSCTVTLGDANIDGGAVTIRADSDNTQTFAPSSTSTPLFFADSALDASTSSIDLPGNGFTTGQRVYYHASGNAIGGLPDGGIYFAIVDPNNPDYVQLAETIEDANAGNAVTLSSPTNANLGDAHSLQDASQQISDSNELNFQLGTYLQDAGGDVSSAIGNLSVFAGVAVALADATIDIGSGSIVNADSFTAHTTTTASAYAAPIAPGVGIAVGVIVTHSVLTVDGQITTSGDATFEATSDHTMNVVSDSSGLGSAAAAQVQNTIKAHVDGSTVTSTGGSVSIFAGNEPLATAADLSNIPLGNDLTLPTTDGSQIYTAAFAGSGAGTFAGGGAITLNWIKNDVEAYLAAAAIVTAKNDLSVSATDSPQINSAATVTIRKGQTVQDLDGQWYEYLGETPLTTSDLSSIDFSGSDWTPVNSSVSATYTASGSGTTDAVNFGDTVDLPTNFTGNGVAGHRYQYIGLTALENVQLTSEDCTNTAEWADVPLNNTPDYVVSSQGVSLTIQNGQTVDVEAGFGGIGAPGRYQYIGSSDLTVSNFGTVDFTDQSKWQPVVYSNTPGHVLAYVDGSQATSNGGDVNVLSSADPRIINITVGGAGSGSVSVSGSISINYIRDIEHAEVRNGSTVKGHGDVGVQAVAKPTMIVIAGNGGGAGNFAAAASSAVNDMQSDIKAIVDDSTVHAETGNLTVHAGIDQPDSLPDPLPATYTGDGNATSATVETGQTVDLTSGYGGTTGEAGHRYKYIGDTALTVTNFNSVDFSDDTQWREVTNEQPDAQIWAFAVSGSVGVGAGVWGGVSFAGAGAGSTNSIANTVQAAITDGASVTTTDGGSINLAANDVSKITADAGGLAVAVAAGLVAGSASIGIAGATNSIDNTVQAYVGQADADTSGAATASATNGEVLISAREDATINAFTLAGSVALAAGAVSGDAALSGSGAGNTITDTVEAFANAGSTATTLGQGDVVLSGIDESSINSVVFAGSIAVSGSGSLALGISAADNEIQDTIEAYGSGATISSAGELTLTATATPSISSLTIAASVSGAVDGVAFSGAGAGSTNNIGNTVEAFLDGVDATNKSTYTAAGDVTVSAAQASNYAPSADSTNAAVAGGSGADVNNDNTISATTTLNDGVNINSSGVVTIAAQDAFQQYGGGVTAGAGGVINGSAALSSSTLDGTANVNIGDSVTITSGTDPINNPSGINLVALSILITADHVTLTTGGAIEGAGVNSSVDGTLTNNVTIGSSDDFTSDGNIGAGSYATVVANTSSEVSTWGLAGVVYVQSAVEPDLTLGSVTASGDVSLAAPGGILDSGDATPQIVSGGSLTLTAGTGTIGTASNPITIDLSSGSGILKAANADGDVYVVDANGDLKVGVAASQNGDVHLTTDAGSILDSADDDNAAQGPDANIFAQSVVLSATGGSIGSDAAYLELSLAAGGTLTATADGNIDLNQLAGDLDVAAVASGADISLRASGSILHADAAASTDEAGNNLNLVADGGTIGAADSPLIIDSAYAAAGTLTSQSQGDAYVSESNDDLTLATVRAANGLVSLDAPDGSILNGLTSGANVIASQTYLVAKTDLGQSSKALATQVARLESESTGGSTWIDNTGTLEIGGITGAATAMRAHGTITVTNHSPIDETANVVAGGAIILTASDSSGSGDDLTVATGASVQSSGSTVLLEDAFDRMSLFGRGAFVLLQDLMDDRQELIELRLRSRPALPIARRFFMIEDLLQGFPVQVVLLADRSLALLLGQRQATDFGPQMHISVHSCSSRLVPLVTDLPSQVLVTNPRGRS